MDVEINSVGLKCISPLTFTINRIIRLSDFWCTLIESEPHSKGIVSWEKIREQSRGIKQFDHFDMLIYKEKYTRIQFEILLFCSQMLELFRKPKVHKKSITV